jgi:carbonic anhydrase
MLKSLSTVTPQAPADDANKIDMPKDNNNNNKDNSLTAPEDGGAPIKVARFDTVDPLDSLTALPTCSGQTPKNLTELLANNKNWAAQKLKMDPLFFQRLSSVQQQPQYLWIGCSDSRVPANHIINTPPGEVFVHRNIANIIKEDDENVMSVLQYAVETLKVKHIIVCGHTNCGGVRACLGPKLTGPLEGWLTPLRQLREKNTEKLDTLSEESAQWRFLCEENVRTQVKSLEQLPVIQNAWANNQPLEIHGLLYSMDEGLLKDLSVVSSAVDDNKAIHKS